MFSAAAAAETSSTAAPHPSSSGRYDHKSGSRPDANAPRRDQISTGVSALDQNRTWSTANAARPGPPTVPKGIGIPASATAPRYAPSAYNRTDAPGATYGTPSGTATNARCVHSRIGAEWLNIFAEVSAATTVRRRPPPRCYSSAEANAARRARLRRRLGDDDGESSRRGRRLERDGSTGGSGEERLRDERHVRRTHASTVHGGSGTVVFSSTKGAVKDDPKSPASTRAYTPCGGGHPSAASRAARSFSCSASVCRALPIMCAEVFQTVHLDPRVRRRSWKFHPRRQTRRRRTTAPRGVRVAVRLRVTRRVPRASPAPRRHGHHGRFVRDEPSARARGEVALHRPGGAQATRPGGVRHRRARRRSVRGTIPTRSSTPARSS